MTDGVSLVGVTWPVLCCLAFIRLSTDGTSEDKMRMRRHIIANTEQVSFYTAYFKPTSIIILRESILDRHDVTMPIQILIDMCQNVLEFLE